MNFGFLTMEDYTIILNALHYYKKVEKRGTFSSMMKNDKSAEVNYLIKQCMVL